MYRTPCTAPNCKTNTTARDGICALHAALADRPVVRGTFPTPLPADAEDHAARLLAYRATLPRE